MKIITTFVIDYFKILPFLTEKFKLSLDIRGKMVYSNGRPLTPMEIKDIVDRYYPIYREEWIFNQILKDLEKEDINEGGIN